MREKEEGRERGWETGVERVGSACLQSHAYKVSLGIFRASLSHKFSPVSLTTSHLLLITPNVTHVLVCTHAHTLNYVLQKDARVEEAYLLKKRRGEPHYGKDEPQIHHSVGWKGYNQKRVSRKLQLLGQVLPLKLGDIYMSAFMLDFVSVHLS